jgi:hypothetical protein
LNQRRTENWQMAGLWPESTAVHSPKNAAAADSRCWVKVGFTAVQKGQAKTDEA